MFFATLFLSSWKVSLSYKLNRPGGLNQLTKPSYLVNLNLPYINGIGSFTYALFLIN